MSMFPAADFIKCLEYELNIQNTIFLKVKSIYFFFRFMIGGKKKAMTFSSLLIYISGMPSEIPSFLWWYINDIGLPNKRKEDGVVVEKELVNTQAYFIGCSTVKIKKKTTVLSDWEVLST